MKILHIISSGGMYGAEAVILNLSRALNESGHSSIIGVFSNSANPNLQLYEAAKQEGIEAYPIPCTGQIDPGVPERIRQLATATQADVLHAHGYKADIYAWMTYRGRRLPLVSTCHNWLDNGFAVNSYGWLDRLALRQYAAVVAVSVEVRDRLLRAGVADNRIRLIRNGVDVRAFANAEPSLRGIFANPDVKLIVGLVGRLSQEKGVDNFLRAARIVVDRLPSTGFAVIGEGPDGPSLDSLIDTLGLRNNVLLLGRREDMARCYASLDVLVSSSRQEGLPIALLEGMASGCPLVATAVGDVPTIARNNQTAILVQADDFQALAMGILQLLQDQIARTRLGLAARQLVAEAFSSSRMASEYADLYGQVLR